MPPPGKNPGSRQRLRRLGFGEEDEMKKKKAKKGDNEIIGPASLPQIRFPQWRRDQNGSPESAQQRSKNGSSSGHQSRSKIPGLM